MFNMNFWEGIVVVFYYGVFEPISNKLYTLYMWFRVGRKYNKVDIEDALSDVIVAIKLSNHPEKRKSIHISPKGIAELKNKSFNYWIDLGLETFKICVESNGHIHVAGVGHSDIYVRKLFNTKERGNFKSIVPVNSFDEALDTVRKLNLHILQNN